MKLRLRLLRQRRDGPRLADVRDVDHLLLQLLDGRAVHALGAREGAQLLEGGGAQAPREQRVVGVHRGAAGEQVAEVAAVGHLARLLDLLGLVDGASDLRALLHGAQEARVAAGLHDRRHGEVADVDARDWTARRWGKNGGNGRWGNGGNGRWNGRWNSGLRI